MDWIPVYGHDTDETVVVIGFECSNCGYEASRHWTKCPKCGALWIPTGEVLMGNKRKVKEFYEEKQEE